MKGLNYQIIVLSYATIILSNELCTIIYSPYQFVSSNIDYFTTTRAIRRVQHVDQVLLSFWGTCDHPTYFVGFVFSLFPVEFCVILFVFFFFTHVIIISFSTFVHLWCIACFFLTASTIFKHINITTPESYGRIELLEYCITPTADYSFKFEVRASDNAWVDLVTDNGTTGIGYQIGIGANDNKRCDIRRGIPSDDIYVEWDNIGMFILFQYDQVMYQILK